MFVYVRAVYDYICSIYAYYFGQCLREKVVIPYDAREKIYDRDPEVLNTILNYYRDDIFGKKRF